MKEMRRLRFDNKDKRMSDIKEFNLGEETFSASAMGIFSGNTKKQCFEPIYSNAHLFLRRFKQNDPN